MAAIPFVDTHFHLYDMLNPQIRYKWLEWTSKHEFLEPLDSIKSARYTIEDFIAEIRFSNVSKAIHVQAAIGTPDPVKETEWIQSMADQHGFPQGIIGECHLERPDVETALNAHLQYANFRGVRDFGPGDYLTDPAWQNGFRLLGKYGLVADIDARPERLPKLTALARSAPEVVVCVDHCSLPLSRTKEYFEMWRGVMRDLAEVESVHMKVSGLGMGDRRWTVESLRPWILTTIELFGVSRIVFGSNWPGDRMYSSYPDLINAYAEIISGFSPDEQKAMFATNAEKLFRI